MYLQMNEGRYGGRTWVMKCESHLSLHWALAESAEVISSVNSCTSWTFLFFKKDFMLYSCMRKRFLFGNPIYLKKIHYKYIYIFKFSQMS